MTVTQRKRIPEEIQAVTEPGVQIECDSCQCDLTHSVRMRCADPVCEPEDGVDICPACFCEGKEFKEHKRWHPYRVVELHSYPIFSEDWGADEELLLLEGIGLQGMGNWQAISEHVGTRTKAEVEEHYRSVFINSPDWPLPDMKRKFDIEPGEFHTRKRRRLAAMDSALPATAKVAPTSVPAIHELAGYLPGRLEFEHELENEAEDGIKDITFGSCFAYGGGSIPEDETDPDLRSRQRWIEDHTLGGDGLPLASSSYYGMSGKGTSGKGRKVPAHNGTNGHRVNGIDVRTAREKRSRDNDDENLTADGEDKNDDDAPDDDTEPLPVETDDSLAFKLALIETYSQRLDMRNEGKQLLFDRALIDFKKLQANDKKRPKEEKELLTRYRPFAKLQTAEDFEVFVADILYEQALRAKIAKLQEYRRLGLRTAADIDAYQSDLAKRVEAKAKYPGYQAIDRRARGSVGPFGLGDDGSYGSREPDGKFGSASAGPVVRKGPAPLNLANSPSLHLLTPAEQALCSTLRILPKPYLVIKETLVREYARRGGKLRRREARELVKIDVNKTSRVWDFLVQAGYFRIPDVPAAGPSTSTENGNANPRATPAPPAMSLSPSKDSAQSRSPLLQHAMPAMAPLLGPGPSNPSSSSSSSLRPP